MFLIIQEHGKYKDFKMAEPDPKTKIYGVRFSQRFFIPAEYDIILAYEPTYRTNSIVSNGGKIRFKSILQRELKDSDLLAFNTKILQRPANTESSQQEGEQQDNQQENQPDTQPDTQPEEEATDERGVIVTPVDES